MELTFIDSSYLLLLIYIPFLIIMDFIFSKYSKRKAILFANFETMKRVSKHYTIKNNNFLLILRIITILFLILSLAGTQITYNGIGENSNYIIAIDSSASMLAKNSNNTPYSRFDLAKSKSSDFIESLNKNTNVGLITFSSITKVENKLTNNKNSLYNSLNKLEISKSSGTNLENAIFTGVNLMIQTKKSRKLIIIGDGQQNIGMPIENAIKYAIKNNVIIYTISTGNENSSKIPSINLEFKVNKNNLESIAKLTGGKYYNMNNINSLESAFIKIGSSKEQIIFFNLRDYLLQIVILILMFEFFLLKTIYKITP